MCILLNSLLTSILIGELLTKVTSEKNLFSESRDKNRMSLELNMCSLKRTSHVTFWLKDQQLELSVSLIFSALSSLYSGLISPSSSLHGVGSCSAPWSLVWGSCVETGSKTTTGSALFSLPMYCLLHPGSLGGLGDEALNNKIIKSRGKNICLSYSWIQMNKKHPKTF